jgi:hypothetical protein
MPAEASRFCLLRHGQSEANVRGLIASSLAVAQEAFGLTAVGRAQVRETVVAARSAGVLPLGCRVVSSPLLRARESAVIAADILGTAVHVDTRLAERGFGDLELSSDDHYERVWGRDRADPAHDNWGVSPHCCEISWRPTRARPSSFAHMATWHPSRCVRPTGCHCPGIGRLARWRMEKCGAWMGRRWRGYPDFHGSDTVGRGRSPIPLTAVTGAPATTSTEPIVAPWPMPAPLQRS